MSLLGRRLRFLGTALCLLLATCFLFRLVFYLLFAPKTPAWSAETLAQAFYLGAKYDLRLALLLLLPSFLLSFWPSFDPTRSRLARRFWLQHVTLLFLAVVTLNLFDLGNYAYQGERIDASALRYLQNPLISLQMVWESYPVGWGICGLLVAGFVFYRLLDSLPAGRATMSLSQTPSPRWRQWGLIVLILLCYMAGIYGKASFYPLRWSDAFFTADKFVADLSLNPLLFFANSLSTAESERAFDEHALANGYDHLAAYLGIETPDPNKRLFARYVRPVERHRTPNIVLIFLESFASHRTGAFGNPLGASPHFDAIAREGMLFRHFYSPRGGTARGVFATLTGIPDTITFRTASRNPLTVRHNTVLRAFTAYRKLYFLGGSANWANIRALFTRNHEDFEIYEEGRFNASRVDVWGITDYDLFTEANARLRALDAAPFFAFIHLSGNHRPYTIPEGIPGFVRRNEEEDRLIEYGFESLAEYNSFRLLDHSLGHFFDLVRKEPYFDNTIFMILSDNGSGGPNRVKPVCEEKLRLGVHHAPLVIYAPALVSPGQVIDTPASQLDVMPTAAALAGIAALNTTLGRNLLDPRFSGTGQAFIYRTRGTQGELLLYDGAIATLVDADGANLHSVTCSPATTGKVRPAVGSGSERDTAELARAFYQASKYLLYNNQPEQYSARGFGPVNRQATAQLPVQGSIEKQSRKEL